MDRFRACPSRRLHHFVAVAETFTLPECRQNSCARLCRSERCCTDFVIRLLLLRQFFEHDPQRGSAIPGATPCRSEWTFFQSGQTGQLAAVQFGLGVLVDNLSVMMLLVVTSVSLVVQIYTHGYMREDPGYSR